MDLKSIIFISLILILTLHAVSASDVNETFSVDVNVIEDYSPTVESDIIQAEITQDYVYDDEINISENEIVCDDILISNESDDYESIEFYEENINKEYCEHISFTHYSNESIDKQEIGSITFAEIPTTFNLNIIHEIELEMHIFMTSFEFKFFESGNLNLLILDVNVCFDKVISKDLTKDVIICAKKIKGNYVYSIDNSISDKSFSLNILSYFNSFLHNHSNNKLNKDSFYLKTLKWCKQ